jgi:peroxiredoxin
MKYLFIITSVLFSFALSGQEMNPSKYGMDTSATLPIGIPIDTIAPIIKTKSVTGEKINTEQLLKKGPVVVLFYRGEWCPVCNRYLSELNKSLSQIKEKGATVLVISPESNVNAQKTLENTKSGFIFISDASLKICNDFDVLFDVTQKYQDRIQKNLNTDIAENNNKKNAQLPVPATFIIDTNGKIIYKQFDYNYKNRANAKDILNAL